MPVKKLAEKSLVSGSCRVFGTAFYRVVRHVCLLTVLSLCLPWAGVSGLSAQTVVTPPAQTPAGPQTRSENAPSTADHSKFEVLKQRFRDGIDVTTACLTCHTEASKQLHQTIHWTWEFHNPETGQTLGMRHVINSYLISTATNEASCTQCHIGNGWVDDSFDFASEANVDCLICHDTTGEYFFEKFHTGEGDCYACHDEKPTSKKRKPRKRPDLAELAQKVGKPSREACGQCHFRGDGGDGVKHGDLDSSLISPAAAVDVHMAADGLNFACTACHTTGGHRVAGSRYMAKAIDLSGIDVPGRGDQSRATCESCHGLKPHPETNHPKLNDHTDRVACPTCHIPELARGGRKTVVSWDWSTAGKQADRGKQIVETDDDGYTTYNTYHGSWKWQADLRPEYRWFNGHIEYTLPGDKIDDSRPVPINRFLGTYADPNARIWPFKVMHGRQPYDPVNKTLALPHLAGRDDTAYWEHFDWTKAVETGMAARDILFSGEVGFVETRQFWPIQHMVAPKTEALTCNECHSRDGRLAALTGFYMPGRDSYPWLSFLGWLGALLTLGGTVVHAVLRILSRLLGK